MAIETLPMQPVTGDPDITYTARQWRAHVVGNLISREGVIDLRGGHMKVTQRGAGANFTVDVAVGRAAVFGDDASEQGTYSINSNTVVNRTIPGASTTVTRTHRVILQVRDRSENGNWGAGVYNSDFIVQADTNAAAPLPASSIALATVAVPANATSVTNAMITDLRSRASVGTAAVEGTFTLASSVVPMDGTRPLRWSVNPDGWVQLSGWARYNGGTFTVAAGFQQPLADGAAGLSDPAIKPPGIRDFPMVTKLGPCHCAVFPDGNIRVRFPTQQQFVSNDTWFSFDGCFYRI